MHLGSVVHGRIDSIFFAIDVPLRGCFGKGNKCFGHILHVLGQRGIELKKAGLDGRVVEAQEALVHLIYDALQLGIPLFERRDGGLFALAIGPLSEPDLGSATLWSRISIDNIASPRHDLRVDVDMSRVKKWTGHGQGEQPQYPYWQIWGTSGDYSRLEPSHLAYPLGDDL